MKKFYLLLSIFLLGVSTVWSQEMYISASFNSYNPGTDSEWQLQPGDADDGEENIYSGYFEISDPEFAFCFQYGAGYIVPAGDPVVAFENEEYSGNILNAADASYWICEDWDGTEIGVVVNLDDNTILIQKYGEVAELWYLRCAANSYDPDDSSLWALYPSEDDEENGVYVGTFSLAAGEFSFNLLSPMGMVFIPQSISNEVISFTDGVFQSRVDYAYDSSEAAFCWTYPDWTGGSVRISIDGNTGLLKVQIVSDSDSVESIFKDAQNGDIIYNLQGARVANPVKGQIYIVNGKKVVL